MFRKKLIAGIMALTLCFSMGACGKAASGSGDTQAAGGATEAAPVEGADADYAKIREKGKLVVGITDFEPMDYKDESGKWIGFDAEMAEAFAHSLDVEVEFVEIEWDNKALELSSGAIDCVWNGMTLTDEVKSAMDCSKPYCNNAQIVIVPSDKADQYQTVESLKDLKFAVEAGSAGEAEAKNNGLNYTPVQSQANALMEVAAGTSDAAIIDSLMAAAMVGEGTSYENLTYTVGLNNEEYGVGFRKGSDLVPLLNKYFQVADTDGTMKAIAEKYGVQAAIIDQK
ncbi:MAG: transporter substrate-binding domain-containing protein [Eubacterium sp.]|nr:transporter substrate-binding domain-containing protein [Eubacterium sp.]